MSFSDTEVAIIGHWGNEKFYYFYDKYNLGVTIIKKIKWQIFWGTFQYKSVFLQMRIKYFYRNVKSKQCTSKNA